MRGSGHWGGSMANEAQGGRLPRWVRHIGVGAWRTRHEGKKLPWASGERARGAPCSGWVEHWGWGMQYSRGGCFVWVLRDDLKYMTDAPSLLCLCMPEGMDPRCLWWMFSPA